MSEELKPCPFCGGAAIEREQPGSFGGYGLTEISCRGCSARASNKDDWNRRATGVDSWPEWKKRYKLTKYSALQNEEKTHE